MVNHSIEYVNREPVSVKFEGRTYNRVKVHTQNVERFNRSLKTELRKKYGIMRHLHEQELYTAGFRVMYSGRYWNEAMSPLFRREFALLWNLRQ